MHSMKLLSELKSVGTAQLLVPVVVRKMTVAMAQLVFVTLMLMTT